jgi:glutathione S-transferase
MTAKPTLIIGNKNYSSWSLRPWLMLRQFDIDFEEIKLPLDTAEFYARIRDYSPSGRVPALRHGDTHVWDSLAICEYVNEAYLGGRGWPSEVSARAHARSISAEMHSGFSALRNEMPMNCRKRVSDYPASEACRDDIARVKSIWREAREHFGNGGDFLFGKFCISDAMYAPVMFRFLSYGVALDGIERAYVDTLRALPAIADWLADAASEPLAPLHEKNTP